MKRKFTNEPWYVGNSDDKEYIDIECNSGRVCSVFVDQDSNITPKQHKANSKLIAAAPDLFYATGLLAQLFLEQDKKFYNKHVEIFNQAVEALRKATE